MISQAELVTKLDTFFKVSAFNESADRQYFPNGYKSIFENFAAPGFLEGTWNGLMLSNAENIERST